MTFYASQHFNRYTNNIKKFVLTANVQSTTTQTDLGSIANTFYLNIQEDWECLKIGERDVCESFWTEGKTNRGVAVIMYPETTFVQLCEIPPESEIYDTDTCMLFG